MSAVITVAAPLDLQGVGHRFGPAWAVRGVSLSVAAGAVVALVGPSGCGKSTLLRIAAGLIEPTEGRVRRGAQRSALVFQQPRLLPWHTAAANIALGLKARGVPGAARAAQAAELGRRLGLTEDDLRKFPHALSGGMQSRVALARALAVAPDLLLLDEPFAALDIGLKLELYALLRERIDAQGIAALLITHDLMEAVRLADRIVLVGGAPGRAMGALPLDRPHAARDDGWLFATTAEVMAQPAVRRTFGLPSPTTAARRTAQAGAAR
jgi:NitT/TauT family transport system ATP-binding protein